MIQLKTTGLDVVSSDNIKAACLFDAPPQGNPRISQTHHAELKTLCGHIRGRVGDGAIMTCSPHRVAVHNCLAVQVSGNSGAVNLLLTVTGSLRWPEPEEYGHATRWYINLTDMVDAVYLVIQLVERLQTE